MNETLEATRPVPTAVPPPPLLSINNIEVVYDDVILVLRGLSLEVPKGAIVALLGANGAGKSTTLKAISGLLKTEDGEVTRGEILFEGQRINGIDPDKIGAFGFSSGGFTVLAVAGGEPRLERMRAHCKAHPDNYDCKLTADHAPPTNIFDAAWVHDPRIKAVVSAAPALGFAFGKDGLKGITAPLQLWKAADDQILPGDEYAEAVHRDFSRPHEYHVVPGAGHFDFLTPCDTTPPGATQPICQSAPGFDRRAFHQDFNAQVTRFFTEQLAAPKR